VKKVKTENWATSWMKQFKPIRIGKRIRIIPSWLRKRKANRGEIAILMTPGMAFGTGEHPTTQLCLAALERLVRTGDRWLDFGSGSAILSIAAAKLGASSVLAIEEDPVAIHYAEANLRQNRSGKKVIMKKDSRPPAAPRF